MDDEQLLDLVADQVRDHIVPVLRDTMRTCVERHLIGDGNGADAYSFGTDAWSFPRRRFLDLSHDSSDFPFEVDCSRGCVLYHGEVRLRHHLVGHSESVPIEEASPRSAIALKRQARQLDLFLPERTERALGDRPVVVAYMANWTDGLCAVYVCTIQHIDACGQIAWAATRELWRADGTDTVHLWAEQVPVETANDPIVTRPTAQPNVEVESIPEIPMDRVPKSEEVNAETVDGDE